MGEGEKEAKVQRCTSPLETRLQSGHARRVEWPHDAVEEMEMGYPERGRAVHRHGWRRRLTCCHTSEAARWWTRHRGAHRDRPTSAVLLHMCKDRVHTVAQRCRSSAETEVSRLLCTEMHKSPAEKGMDAPTFALS